VSGTLYLVATPIGNLEDITFRAVRLLREVAIIACEDTRHTRKLLDHYGIERPTISYHEHNENSRAGELIERLESGQDIALVSDAGTPLVSDPGYRLVSQALHSGVRVVPVPGPSAILAALTASGLPTDSFYFGGFLPAKRNQRRAALQLCLEMDCTAIFYEAPHRIAATLEDISELLPGHPVVLSREITKLHEEFLSGDAQQVLKQLSEHNTRGEMTILIGKGKPIVDQSVTITDAVSARMNEGLSRMDAMKAVARERGLSKREVYAAVESGSAGTGTED
jgi:16S rRNA (cytidine1402-2'-O)-methyltransferase